MLKNNDKLDPKVVSALIYAQSLLSDGEELVVSVKKDKILVATSNEEIVEPIVLDTAFNVNPIANMLDHVNEEMCTDCVQIDYLYRDPYFKSLVSTYTDSLVHEFGVDVPIPMELARAIVRHDIGEYSVRASKDAHVTWPHTGDHIEELGKQGWLFHLRAK